MYFGESDIFKTLVVINHFYDTDKLLVVEIMSFVFAYSRTERYGLRIKYHPKEMHQNDKEYEIETLYDALSQATSHLNHIYFEKYDIDKHRFNDFDSFQKSCLIEEINPISLLHVLDNSIIDKITYVSKNASFTDYLNFLKGQAQYTVEIIE